MAVDKRVGRTEPIIPEAGTAEALAGLCPDLDNWPQSWRHDQADLALGEHMVAFLRPFLFHLLAQRLATKTLYRHRDHLWMLGGEIIRRCHEDLDLRRKSIEQIVLQFIDDDCGPLIWPSISEQQQDAFDATCRKLHQFLVARSQHPQRPQKTTHRFR